MNDDQVSTTQVAIVVAKLWQPVEARLRRPWLRDLDGPDLDHRFDGCRIAGVGSSRMKTLFLLMAQYDGQVIIPLERICSDYFIHLTPDKLRMKVAAGQIDLPIIALEQSQKSARGVHVNDLADYLDARQRLAKAEHDRLMRKA